MPIRFTDRSRVFATPGNSDFISRSLAEVNCVRSLIFTGSWFFPAVAKLRIDFPDLKLICDTHDVFFVVDRDSNYGLRRVFYNQSYYKKIELKYLNSVDLVVAISNSDKESLSGAGCLTEVVVDSGSFSHAIIGLDAKSGPECFVFGFIGSNNDNNKKSLFVIRDFWWPRILKFIPGAKLYIAGGICDSLEAKEFYLANRENVALNGFVGALGDFYSSVTVMLSPILVQGGLNFKSVEALISGRILLTNELGSRCIGEGEGVYIVGNDGEGIDDFCDELMSLDDIKGFRVNIQKNSLERFGDSVAYSQLLKFLR